MSECPIVKVERLNSVDAFVVFDLDHAETSVGVTRLAPKVLVDGATWLARSQTYQLASFEIRAGGASAGINAKPPDRDEAVRGFVDEVEPWVEAGRFLTEPARGLDAADLDRLGRVDRRGSDFWAAVPELTVAGLMASAEAGGASLDGRTVAIEGFERYGATLTDAVAGRGGRVVAIGTASGAAVAPGGFDPAVIAERWAQDGSELVTGLVADPGPPASVLAAPAEVLFVGSKAGVLEHGAAVSTEATLVVPTGPVPVTAKALAVLVRNGAVVLPDFLTTAGPALIGFRDGVDGVDGGGDSARYVTAQIGGALEEVLAHEKGVFVGACLRAEAFLSSWCDTLPFGRPLS
jgi:glutamate dehydrogenase (NAD(P)+)